MLDNSSSKKVSLSFFWKIMENGGSQGVQFIVSLVLARLLSPKEYGLIAMATIFITIANVLVQNGFATALIQRKDDKAGDYSSVIILNFMVALALYLLLYFFSPEIAAFFDNPEIPGVLKSLGLVVFPGGVISVQNAYISKRMRFKSLFIATFFASILSGIVSIYLAFKHFGVYALVWQQLIYYFSLMTILFIVSDFKFIWDFEIYRLKLLFSFGWKILVASLIDTAFENLNALVLGKVYNEETLGNYNRGEQFPKLIVMNLGSAIQSVMLPLMSAKQDSKESVRELLKNSVRLAGYIILPMMAGLIAVADILIAVLLGEKWLSSVPFLRFLCLAYAFWPIHIANLQAINALGRSDKFLKLEIIKKIIGLTALAIGVYFGSIAVVAMKAVADFIGIFVNSYPNKELLDYDIKKQIKDVFPSFALSTLMGLIIYFVSLSLKSSFTSLILLIILGIFVYIALSILTKNRDLQFLKESFLKIRSKNE